MAPEFWNHCYNPIDADLFACGVMLFALRTGSYPFYESTNRNSYYNKIIRGETEAFWAAHEKQKKLPKGYFSEDFKSLLNFMFSASPVSRLTMADVMCHPWMRNAHQVTN